MLPDMKGQKRSLKNMANLLPIRAVLLPILFFSACAQIPPEMELITRINNQVKREHRYQDKPKNYTPTRAMFPGESGNCADFAVTKCKRLEDAGIAKERLSMVKFIRNNGVHHAVCVVDNQWAMDWNKWLVPATPKHLDSKTNLFPYNPLGD